MIFAIKYIPYIWAKFDEAYKHGKIKTLADISRDSAIVLTDKEMKYNFSPVPDKQSGNYVLLKIRNLNDYPFDVIMNYGKDEKKNGSFTFTVAREQKFREYLIRVSSQYNWMNNDNNWLTMMPVGGGNIEVRAVKILKGD